MRQNFSLTTYNTVQYVLCLSVVVGLVVSRALLSIAVALMLLNMLLHVRSLRFDFVSLLKGGLLFIPFSLLIMMPFAPDFYKALELMYHKLPLIIVPIAIWSAGFNKTQFSSLTAFYVLVMAMAGAGVFFNYLLHLEEFTQALSRGVPIPAPHGHIRFSLLLSFAVAAAMHHAVSHSSFLKIKSYMPWLLAGVFLFVLQHILSVRIGIISMYASLLFLFFYHAVKSKRYYFAIMALGALMAVPVVAYQTIPSFKNRIDYMRYDWEQMKSGDAGYNSDSRRMISLKVGWELATENIFMGVGVGYLEEATENYYLYHYPEIEDHNRKLPHNQFLSSWVELGLPGLLAMLLVFILPFLIKNIFRKPLFLSLWIIVFLSVWVDTTFETQIGIVFYSLLSSLLLKFEND
jgi:O-antigen ligase